MKTNEMEMKPANMLGIVLVVAVARKGKIFLFSAGWLDPQEKMREDFNRLLDTVTFIR